MRESGNRGGMGGWEAGDAGRRAAAEAGGMCESGHREAARKRGHVQVGTRIRRGGKRIGFSLLTRSIASGVVAKTVALALSR
jgi:hypothetical protein